MQAVFEEDVATMARIASKPELQAMGLGETEVSQLCDTFRTADGESAKRAKRLMTARLGMLTFGIWQSRDQFGFSGPEESLRNEADGRYLESFEAVKAAAVAFYTQQFERCVAHQELREIGDHLFANQAHVDP